MTTATTAIAGYQGLLDQLQNHVNTGISLFSSFLSKSKNSHAARQYHYCYGILLTGSAGVGKTFLVSTLAHVLTATNTATTTMKTTKPSHSPRVSSSSPSSSYWHIQWMDVQNLLMKAEAISGTSDCSLEEITEWIMLPASRLPPPPKNKDDDENADDYHTNRTNCILMVLDNLHLLEQDDNGNGSNDKNMDSTFLFLNPVARRVQAAIRQVLELITFSSWSLSNHAHVQVIGISRNSNNNMWQPYLSSHFCVDTPTEYQRQEILFTLLSTTTTTMTQPPKSEQQEQQHDNHNNTIQKWSRVLARQTAGFVAADLVQLLANAHLRAQTKRTLPSLLSSSPSPLPLPLPSPSSTSVVLVGVHSCGCLTWDDLVWVSTQSNLVPSQWKHLNIAVSSPKRLFTAQSMADEKNDDVMTTNFNSSSFLSCSWQRAFDQAWQPFAGYVALRKRLYRTIVVPWRRHVQYILEQLHLQHQQQQQNNNPTTTGSVPPPPPPRGVVFWGPSGCGKTLAAACLAASFGAGSSSSSSSWPMIRVTASDILSPWLGGAEAALRQVFARARSVAPCLLLLDELDALATNRGTGCDDGNDDNNGGVMSRLLSTFLNELDGIAATTSTTIRTTTMSAAGILVVACTNRMASLDAALLRPGRLEEHVAIPLPTVEDAMAILRHYWTVSSTTTPTKTKKNCINNNHGDNGSTAEFLSLWDENECPLESLAIHLVAQNNHGDDDDKGNGFRASTNRQRCVVSAATLEGVARQALLHCIRRQEQEKQHEDDEQATVTPKISLMDIQQALKTLHLPEVYIHIHSNSLKSPQEEAAVT